MKGMSEWGGEQKRRREIGEGEYTLKDEEKDFLQEADAHSFRFHR